VFELDEAGYARVASPVVPVALEALVARAAANCPERAIEVDEPTTHATPEGEDASAM
jgi:ferredoxin